MNKLYTVLQGVFATAVVGTLVSGLVAVSISVLKLAL